MLKVRAMNGYTKQKEEQIYDSKIIFMLTAEQQQKIISGLLKRSENLLCADCGNKTPCWASLDFGVFVCMNCSGAHRHLGPSVTRIKSTTLDTWSRDWVNCMQVGNSTVNKYWEAHINNLALKPNSSSSMHQIIRFVEDKYLRKKYIDRSQKHDPLTKFKMGIPLVKQITVQPKQIKKIQPIKKQTAIVQDLLNFQYKNTPATKKEQSFQNIFFQKTPFTQTNNNKNLIQLNQINSLPNNFVNNKLNPAPQPSKNYIQNIPISQNFSYSTNDSFAKGLYDQFSIPNNQTSKHVSYSSQAYFSHNNQKNQHRTLENEFYKNQNIFVGQNLGVNSNRHCNFPHGQHVTMNINMNMYSKFMNINMPNAPTNSINLNTTIDLNNLSATQKAKETETSWANEWK